MSQLITLNGIWLKAVNRSLVASHERLIEQWSARLRAPLLQLIAQLESPLVAVREVSTQPMDSGLRASFQLEFADGKRLKGRRLSSEKQAERVFQLAALLDELPFAAVIAHSQNALLEAWIDGRPLAHCSMEPTLAHQAGEILGQLSRVNVDQFIQWPQRTLDSQLEKLTNGLVWLENSGLIDSHQQRRLLQLATDNAPTLLNAGLIHLDFSPQNIIQTADGLWAIDNESLEIGVLDCDLARTFCLWPMDEATRHAFIDGYRPYRSVDRFIRHETFWAIVTLVKDVIYRTQHKLPEQSQWLALNRLMASAQNCPWLTSERPADRPIRVGFICDNLAIGGQEQIFVNLLAGLNRSRFEPFAYAFRGGAMVAQVKALGVPLAIGSDGDPLAWMSGWSRQDYNEKEAWQAQLTELLVSDRIDAVVIFAWPDGVRAACSAGVAVLIEKLDGPDLIANIADKSAFQRAVCESATIRQQVTARSAGWKIAPQRISMIYPGINLDHFNPDRFDADAERRRLRLNPADRVVGFVGRLAPVKNLELLLQAFARVVENNPDAPFQLLMLGPDGGSLAVLQQLVIKLNLGERVRLEAPQSDVAPVLAALDLFAIPSRSEGLPTVLLKAMAMGLPLIATDVGSIHELIDGNGVLVNDNDIDGYAAALGQLLSNREMASIMGQKSRDLSARFSQRVSSAAYEQLIENALLEVLENAD